MKKKSVVIPSFCTHKFHKIVNDFIFKMLKKKIYGFGIVDPGSEIRDLRLDCGGHNIAS